jgi:hypothetical protein
MRFILIGLTVLRLLAPWYHLAPSSSLRVLVPVVANDGTPPPPPPPQTDGGGCVDPDGSTCKPKL